MPVIILLPIIILTLVFGLGLILDSLMSDEAQFFGKLLFTAGVAIVVWFILACFTPAKQVRTELQVLTHKNIQYIIDNNGKFHNIAARTGKVFSVDKPVTLVEYGNKLGLDFMFDNGYEQ